MTNRAMSDSNVKWIGDIPNNWSVEPIGKLFTERNTKVSDLDFPPLSVTKKGIVPQLENAAKSKNHNDRKQVNSGDFVINSRSDRKMSSGLSSLDGSVSLINIVLTSKSVFPGYTKYLLKNYGFAEEFYRWGTGIVADLWSTRYERMKRILVPYPSYEEQQKIATFLDEKVSHIDNIIEDTKKSIENLKAYKQSLITETVTKGLNPDVEMKDSGIEWIGELPANWQLVKLSRLTTSYSGGTPKRNEERYWKNGTIPWVSSGEVNKRVITESDEKISEEGLNESSAKLFPPKTVLVALNGQGKTKAMSALLEIEAATNQSLVGFIPNKLLNYKYLNFTFIASYSYNRSYYAGGNKRDGIAAGELKSRLIPLPSIDIQIEIVRFLEGKISHINSLILEKENLLISLNTYKKSIIYEYVTGKKEVK